LCESYAVDPSKLYDLGRATGLRPSEDLENPPSKAFMFYSYHYGLLICFLASFWRKNMSQLPNSVPGNDEPTFLYVAGFVSATDDVPVPTARIFNAAEPGLLTITTGNGDFRLNIQPGDRIEFLVPDRVSVNGEVREI
jgi:hypothetical protein